eukprot:7957819-Lingulodinium_polyedra.AAC.1
MGSPRARPPASASGRRFTTCVPLTASRSPPPTAMPCRAHPLVAIAFRNPLCRPGNCWRGCQPRVPPRLSSARELDA